MEVRGRSQEAANLRCQAIGRVWLTWVEAFCFHVEGVGELIF